ncbi:MAG TPA: uracil-DNA glycosylase family protein, partial [Thermoanaerobaculia bacterium]|nr:uracil-DNA glycosylase family protein [Thermoanaerobaculia bacterium]
RAGQLLTDIIKAMKLTRDDVYIANVIKCRPPENRNPEPDELDACRPYIRRQIWFSCGVGVRLPGGRQGMTLAI